MKLLKEVELAEIVELIGAQVIGVRSGLVNGINEIHKVAAGDVTFADHPKYYQAAVDSAATYVIVDNAEGIEIPDGKALLLVEHPFDAFNTLSAKYYGEAMDRAEKAQIHATALVHPTASVAEDVRIGARTIVHANVSICAGVHIGEDVVIQANCVIGGDAFYYKKKADGYDRLLSTGRVLIEDRVEIGSLCSIDRGVSGDTVIGYGTKLDSQVHVAHGCVIGRHCLIAAQVGIAGKTILEDHVTLWGQVGVNKDLRIGEGAVVYAQSGVPKSIAGGKVYFGSPVKEVRTAFRELAALGQLPDFLRDNRSRGK